MSIMNEADKITIRILLNEETTDKEAKECALQDSQEENECVLDDVNYVEFGEEFYSDPTDY